MTIFSDRLKEARKKAGYSGPKLAAMIGVKYNAYIRYETQGGEPRQETLVKIARTLGVSIDWLLGNKEEQKDIFPLLQNIKSMLLIPDTVYNGHSINNETRKQLLRIINDVDTEVNVSIVAEAMDYFEKEEGKRENGENNKE